MSETIILTTPDAARSNRTLARESHQLRASGARELTRVPHGTVARLAPEKIADLEKKGFRVTRYSATDRIDIAGRSIDTQDPTKGLSAKETVPGGLADQWPLHVVQFVAPPFPDWRDEVAQTVEVVGRAGAYGVYVHAEPDDVKALQKLPFVHMTSPLQPGWKVESRLIGATGVQGELSVSVFPPDQKDKVIDAVTQAGGKVLREEPGRDGGVRLVVEIDRAQALDLAALPAVHKIAWLPPVSLEGERETQILAENLNATAAPNQGPVVGYQNWLTLLGATGDGVTVAIADSGIDMGVNNNATGHLDLRGRQANYIDYTGVNTDQNGHGTHVAGIAVGNAATGTTEGAAPNNFLWGQGVAPGAQYVGQAMQQAANPTGPNLAVPAIATLCSDSVTNGATIQNNSWSAAPSPNNYAQRESDYDAAVRDADGATTAFEGLTTVFAARNSGGLGQTIGDPSSAKNVITVGNGLTRRVGVNFPNDDINGLNGSSSRGPASGGRIKPDIVAPGTDVSAARSSASTDTQIPGEATYTYKTGTSMSAPLVTGACAVLTEWWGDRTDGRNPSPAMLKAMLINGAEDMVGGANWRRLRGNLIDATNRIYQVTGVGFTPTQVVVPNVTLAQVPNTAGMGNQTWNFNAGTLTVRITGMGNTINAHCLDAPIANIPNNDQGWGRVSLENIVFQEPTSDRGPRLFLDQRHAFTANGQEHTWRIKPDDTTRPMRATLVWTDAPGAVNDNTPLVNNLNLEIDQDVGGTVTTWRGNNFTNGFSTAGGAADTANNVECVYLQNPNGVYTLRVRAATLAADARLATATAPWQDYALVLENAVFAATDPAAVSVVLDRSGSMVSSGYVDVTRSVSKQFIDLLNADDSVGVVSFGNDAVHEYADSNEAVDITGATEKNAAKTAVDGIGFGGCTYMGQGLEFAQTQVGSATGNRAVVLLSDGKDNKGCDQGNSAKQWAVDVAAAMPSAIDVYTCAMGPLSDQQNLEDIADLTGGRYYYMPTIDDLYEIYNFIRGNVTSTGVIVNTTSTASSSRVPAMVDCGVEQVVLACHWHDSNLDWVSYDPVKPNQIMVRLRSPSGKVVPAGASWVSRRHGEGYVIFTIEEPPTGRWYVEVATARNDHTNYTVGGWVQSDTNLVWDLGKVGAGRGLQARVALKGVDGLGVRYGATLVAPRVSVPELLAAHKAKLDRIQPDPDLIKNGVDPDLAKLAVLDAKLIKDGKPSLFATAHRRLRPLDTGVPGIIGTHSRPVDWKHRPSFADAPILMDPGAVVQPGLAVRPIIQGVIGPVVRAPPSLPPRVRPVPGLSPVKGFQIPTKLPGSYTIRVKAEAVNPKTGCRIERIEARSFVVGRGR